MKTILRTLTLALSIMFLGAEKNKASAQAGVGVSISYQSFYDELSPHGRWIDYPDHGYVWAPNLESEFQPYRTGGQWVWSDEYDWMWVSDYSWGWAPFHYGRWFRDDYYGWMWMPGYEWSPGWVSWRTGGDYYGWAPLRPGISIGIDFRNYNPTYDYWCFAPRRYVNHRSISNYCVDRSRNITIINNTTIINNHSKRNNVFVNGGPHRGDVEKYTGGIRSVNFRETNRPSEREFRNNRISVYRPQIQWDHDRRFSPRKFDPYSQEVQNNRNIIRNNGNNQPDRSEGTNSRTFGRNDTDTRQPVNNNIASRRRNVFEQDNNQVNTRESNRPNDQRTETSGRGNVFDRKRNNDRPDAQQPGDDRRPERPGISNRDIIRQADNNQREQGTFERRHRALQQNDRQYERREVFQRNSNSTRQPDRKEIRNERRQQRQTQPQIERQFQRESRQFENRGNEQRGRKQQDDTGAGDKGRYGRRDR